MIEILIMVVGSIFGFYLLKIKDKLRIKLVNYNNKLQLITVSIIIFIMGINLGSMENFLQKIVALGGYSIIFAILPTVFSIILVYVLSRLFIIKN